MLSPLECQGSVVGVPQYVSVAQSTVCMALLQPQRETYNLFDDVLLLADGESLPCLCPGSLV